MKYRLLLSFFALIISYAYTPSSQAYNLTDNDYTLLDTVEDKIFDIIESSNNVDIDDVISILWNIQTSRNLIGKHKEMLEVMIADMYRYAGYDESEEDYEKLTAEDCYDDEYFDAEDERCYIKKEEAQNNETDYDYNPTHDKDNHSDISGDKNSWSDEEKTVAVYTYTNEKLTLTSWTDNDEYRKTREDFKKLFPTRRTEFINSVQFFDSEESDTGAYVERTNDAWKKRLVAFNMSAIREWNNEELVYTWDVTYHHIRTKSDVSIYTYWCWRRYYGETC